MTKDWICCWIETYKSHVTPGITVWMMEWRNRSVFSSLWRTIATYKISTSVSCVPISFVNYDRTPNNRMWCNQLQIGIIEVPLILMQSTELIEFSTQITNFILIWSSFKWRSCDIKRIKMATNGVIWTRLCCINRYWGLK